MLCCSSYQSLYTSQFSLGSEWIQVTMLMPTKKGYINDVVHAIGFTTLKGISGTDETVQNEI